MGGLGRREPKNFDHVASYPLSAVLSETAYVVPPDGTEKSLGLPWWWKQHDQGQEGSCVGFGCSTMMSVTNHYQRLVTEGRDLTYRYEPRWLYGEAQLVDEWSDTPPEEGTSVNAGCKILKDVGHRRVQNGVAGEPNLASGISAYRWATTVDELRAAIYSGLAVAIGVNWYSDFDQPVYKDSEWWIGQKSNLGSIRGGHCVGLFRMSDRRQAFRFMNSWGDAYPPVWLPYAVMQRLIDENGEAVAITDR